MKQDAMDKAVLGSDKGEKNTAYQLGQDGDAAHLLDFGTGLRYIQDLREHKSSRIRETCLPVGKVHTHVSTQAYKK